MRILLAALLLIACTCDELPFKKVIHNTDPNAKCLDGSPPALYVHEGGDPTKFIIFFNGGGACFGNSIAEVLENCYQRSKTDLGSSKGLKDEIIVNGGYLSTDPAKSKFAGWTKIIIEYCDGSVHQGNSLNGVKYKDTELFFRGAVNTRSHFAYLRTKYNFKDAGSVVLTGSSAGAQATALWINYVRSLLTDPSVMVSIPDSGVFLNVASPETGQYN
jgi:O-palmitoleoyl-L-serine hydrolase